MLSLSQRNEAEGVRIDDMPGRREFDVNIGKLLHRYLRKWWIIVLSTVLFALSAYFYTANYVTPRYQASVMIYVNNTKGVISDSITDSNLTASAQLVRTYINMIRRDSVLDKVADQLGDDYSAAMIRANMSALQVQDTELFYVAISDVNPERAARIANAIADVAPEAIESFIEGSSTKVVDYAKVPTASFYPSYSKNIQLGALIGFALPIGILTLMHFLDSKIYDEEDLELAFDHLVLGSIPIFKQRDHKPVQHSTRSKKRRSQA